MSSLPQLHWDDEGGPDDDWGKLLTLPVRETHSTPEWPSQDHLRDVSRAVTIASRVRIPTFDIEAMQETFARAMNQFVQSARYMQSEDYHARLRRMGDLVASAGETSRKAVSSAMIMAMFERYLDPSSYRYELLSTLARSGAAAFRLLDAVEAIGDIAGVERASLTYFPEEDEQPITLWARISVDEPAFDQIEEALYRLWEEQYADLVDTTHLAVV